MSIEWTKIHNFKPEEFERPDLLRWDMLYQLDQLREMVGFPLKITSSFRTAEHNATLPTAAQDSAHLADPTDGEYSGVDIAVNNAHEMFSLLKAFFKMDFGCRLGIYPAHLHLDIESRLPQGVAWVGKDS